MQILGLADSTPRPENRLKSLLWPRIRYVQDVEHVTLQGFWVSQIIAAMTLALGWIYGGGFQFTAFLVLFLSLGGIGIREQSRAAAVAMFVSYVLDTLVTEKYLRIHPGLVRIVS